MPEAQQSQQQDVATAQDTAPPQDAQSPEGQEQQAPDLDDARLQSAVRFNRARGYNRARVQAIQRKIGVDPDGSFGPATTRAIFAFQVSRPQLENDGKLGPATFAAIIATPAAASGPGSVELSRSQISNAVRFNRNRAYRKARIIAIQEQIGVNPDGSWGPVTVGALAEWQAAHGLQADGKAGQSTLSAMHIVQRPKPRPTQEQQPGEEAAQQQTQDETQQEEPQGPQEAVPEGNVTSNFTWLEFRSRGDQKAVPAELRANVTAVCEELEKIRAAFDGRTIRINSGYRSPYWNRKVGGKPGSYHKRGMAVDFNVAGIRPSAVRKKLNSLMSTGKIKQGGLGSYATFTHYDIRGSAARWSG